jgi:hypothetical protein
MIILVVVLFVLRRAPLRMHLYFCFGLLVLSLTVCSTFKQFFMPAFEQLVVRLLLFDVCTAFEQAFVLYQGTCLVFLVIAMLGLRNRFSFYVVDSVGSSKP